MRFIDRGSLWRLGQRLTFPFPFVHHQPHDWKVEQLSTVETRSPPSLTDREVESWSTVMRWMELGERKEG
jgi:hypothetical protein